MNRFNKFIKVVEKAEGGYVNDPADRGAETYKGISRKFHPNWPGWGVVDKHKPLKTNQFINDPELDKCVEDFYETSFWKPSFAWQFTDDLASLHHFDFSVNAGLRNAAKLVQRTVGVADDGVIGPATVKAVNETANMAQKYSDARKAYYTKISENGQNAKFLAGWLKRVDNINKALA